MACLCTLETQSMEFSNTSTHIKWIVYRNNFFALMRVNRPSQDSLTLKAKQ